LSIKVIHKYNPIKKKKKERETKQNNENVIIKKTPTRLIP
jgi:hypothetical protein